jgi:SNF2 family DNA or RNA helicase
MVYERKPQTTNNRIRVYSSLAMRGSLRPCQTRALQFMRGIEDKGPSNGLCGGMLCLTMGLGKSVSAAAHSLTAPSEGFPTLIICSKTLMGEWRMQCMRKFFGGIVKVLYLHKDYIGEKAIVGLTREKIVEYDFVITTYDVILSAGRKFPEFVEEVLERGDAHSLYKDKVIGVNVKTRVQSDDASVGGVCVLFKTPWERVVIDESQRIANPDTVTWRYMMAIYGKFKWCLTGTPIRNYVSDLWAQLRWVGLDVAKTKRDWKRRPQQFIRAYNLLSHTLSMGYKDAGIVMPPLVKTYVDAEFSSDEAIFHKYLVGQLAEIYEKFQAKEASYSCVLAQLTKLRQCCIAPYIMTKEAKRDELVGLHAREDWIGDKAGTAGMESARMKQMVEILSSIPSGEKTIVFTSFTSASDLLADTLRLKLPSLKFTQIDGGVVGQERDEAIHQFRRPGSDIQVCILTYKVGGEGLNLTCASRCVMIEPWWNYAVRDQAEARAWRSGQTKTVTSYYPQILNSIEFNIEALCQAKKRMGTMIMTGEDGNLPNIGLSSGDVEKLIRVLC